jgi:hypothetical protein
MQTEQQKTIDKEIRNSPIAWFYILEDSRRQGDFRRAAEAQQELVRLGVEVRYHENIHQSKTDHARCVN